MEGTDRIREGAERLSKKLNSFFAIRLHKVRFFRESQPEWLTTSVQECLAAEFLGARDKTCVRSKRAACGQASGKNDVAVFGTLCEQTSARVFECHPFGWIGCRARFQNFRHGAVVFHDFQIRARWLMRCARSRLNAEGRNPGQQFAAALTATWTDPAGFSSQRMQHHCDVC